VISEGGQSKHNNKPKNKTTDKDMECMSITWRCMK